MVRSPTEQTVASRGPGPSGGSAALRRGVARSASRASRRRRGVLGRLGLVCAVAFAGVVPEISLAQAEDEQAQADRRPLLDELNRETQGLYQEAMGGLVRVELPTPRWANPVAQREELLKRWPNLRPEVKRQLEQGLEADQRPEPPGGTTRPATRQAGPAEDASSGAAEAVVVIPPVASGGPGDGSGPGGVRGGEPAPGKGAKKQFTPNNMALLLDKSGHLLVPLYIERETVGAAPLRVAGRDGAVREATFVGSDRQTNLTVLKLSEAGEGGPPFPGVPLPMSRQMPADGSLVLYVAPRDGSARLGVWTAGAAADFDIVFTTDGRAAGVARYGQFLSGPACRLIADQIIRHGEVRRATLGVIITEIRQDDPLRRRIPVLGTRTAVRVTDVIPGSAAAGAGLRAGDLLLSLAGEAVGDIPSLAAAIASRSGQTEIQFLRDGEIHDTTVELKQE